jgi:hypothetical protein
MGVYTQMSIERPEDINGYTHPKSVNVVSRAKQSKYKTFDETNKKKAKSMEEFGTNAQTQYANTGKLTHEYDAKCPTCSGVSVSTCPCGYSDKKCSNGHVWYTDRNGKIKMGNPH